jgi:hypothetical protein
MAKIDGRVKRKEVLALAAQAECDPRTARRFLEDPRNIGPGLLLERLIAACTKLGLKAVAK